MPHITSIGSGVFSNLAIAMPTTNLTAAQLAALDTAVEFQALFATEIPSIGGTKATGTFVRVTNVREYPAMGTPPNVVNVPVYGQKTSQQIQGQSDAASLEITLNLVTADWAKAVGNLLGNAVGDGVQYVFRFTLMNSDSTGVGATKFASSLPGIGSVENSQWYWIGKIDAFQVTPQLTDANTAVVTMTLQSDLYGPYTI